MPASRSTLSVCILGRDYTLEATTDAHPRLTEAARRLDAGMRAQQARDPAADMAQLAVLAALDVYRAAAPTPALNEREIARALGTLQRKLDRLEAALVHSEPAPSANVGAKS